MFEDEIGYCVLATATTLGDAIVGLPVSPRQRRSNQIPMRLTNPGAATAVVATTGTRATVVPFCE